MLILQLMFPELCVFRELDLVDAAPEVADELGRQRLVQGRLPPVEPVGMLAQEPLGQLVPVERFFLFLR